MSITFDPAWFQPDWPPPLRCDYCGEATQALTCLDHQAWSGAGLCVACYLSVLADVPVLPGTSWRAREGGAPAKEEPRHA